jgi:hypothetical protein
MARKRIRPQPKDSKRVILHRGEILQGVIGSFKSVAEGFKRTYESIDPKILELAGRVEAIGNLSLCDVAGSRRRKGRPPKSETSDLLRQVLKLRGQGRTFGQIALKLRIPANRLRALVSDNKVPPRR